MEPKSFIVQRQSLTMRCPTELPSLRGTQHEENVEMNPVLGMHKAMKREGRREQRYVKHQVKWLWWRRNP